MTGRQSHNPNQPSTDRNRIFYQAKTIPTILIRNRESGKVMRINFDDSFDYRKHNVVAMGQEILVDE